MRILTALILSFSLVAPQSARALECVEYIFDYELRDAYWEHQLSDKEYLLVYGALRDLEFTEKLEPESSESFDLPVEIWTAKFEGNKASPRAFDQPFVANVTISITDGTNVAGGGSAANAVGYLQDRNGLLWLEVTDDGYHAFSGLCGSSLDEDPSHVKPALRCLRGGYCPKRG